MMLKIAVAQLNFIVGAIEGNAQRIIDETNRIASQQHIDLVVFPELALSGYPPEDLLFRPGFYKRCRDALMYIAKNTRKTGVIVGYPDKINGKNYNKAAFIQNGKIIVTYAKQELPNETVFDEKRYFASGGDACVFEINNIKIGLLICEDLWHPTPIQQAKAAGAQCIISINASPYHRKQFHAREHIIQQRISEAALPIVYGNLVGGQDELVFDGGSMVVNADSILCCRAPYFAENTMIANAHLKNNQVIFDKTIIGDQPGEEAQIYEALKLGVQDYITKNHFPGALIGLSGGIDSALTLAIAVDAIGADRVTAVLMPSRFTQEMSIDDAIAEANALNVDYHLIPIDSLFEQYLQTLSPIFKNAPADATEENLQARIRGMLLMALSNKTGKIVLTTGNKSEMSVGYATLYGDMAGGFAVIKDVAKTMVYRLSAYRNHLKPVIPERVLKRAPSAELAPNQMDQDKLPPYNILDDILERYIERDEDPVEIISAGFDKKIVDDVVRMVNSNEYKRRQAAIGVRLTQRAFGKDRRYPITSRY